MSEASRRPEDQYVFSQTYSSAEILAEIEASPTVSFEERIPDVNVAGRVMALRDQGNLVFADLRDITGTVQLIAEQGVTDAYEELAQTSTGDWLGVIGEAGLSKRGQPSIYVNDWTKLAETQEPFPRRGGLIDPETRVRRRYLDLASNEDSRQRFVQRSKMVAGIRELLSKDGFLEVETPILQSVHGGAAARPFETHHNALNIDLSLRIAPELYLKRLVVGGFERVFEIGRNFRNEGISQRHNPEFTMMEVYAAYWDYEDQMRLTERLVSEMAKLVTGGSTVVEYQGEPLDLTPPWTRTPMDRLLSDKLGEDIDINTPMSRLEALCRRFNIGYEPEFGPGKLVTELYEATTEADLWDPIFVTDYPAEVSPLARGHRTKPGYTERFEGVVAKRELCNGYTELNDPLVQYQRFMQQEGVKEVDDEAMPIDHDYIRALRYGLPPTAGMGIGVDRLAMLLTNTANIRDVVLFPTMRPDGYVSPYGEEDLKQGDK
ncbi:MAG: lysine--tRNA ligase [Candidatus Saccharimonadales bacterium]